MSYTLTTSSLLSPLLGDPALTPLFDAPADLQAMLDFERALAAQLAGVGLIPTVAAMRIDDALQAMTLDARMLDEGIVRDGLAVPRLIELLRERLDADLQPHFHVGTTSQDVVDTSLMLRARVAFALLAARVDSLIGLVDALIVRYGSRTLDGRTRLQRALPIQVADRLGAWRTGLAAARTRLAALRFPLQLGGPVGTLTAYGTQGPALRAALATALDLDDPGHCWHTAREPVLHLADAATAITAALGKLGLDAGLMAQNGIDELVLEGAGRSSAMAHKRNPVQAETLVALARYAAGLHGTLQQATLHEFERSGAAWTLEWLCLPPLIVGAGAATLRATLLLESIASIGR